jgi:hypothetical protein
MTAAQKPLMIKPGVIALARSSRRIFRIKLNRPKVRIVMGKVSKVRMGFKKVLRTPITTAATMAVVKLAT